MDLIVKSREFETLAVVDLYSSLIWTERYSEMSDFELYIPMPSEYTAFLSAGNYLMLPDTDRVMIIESVEMDSDISTGEKKLCYKGRGLESILDRRIVWKQTDLNGSVEAMTRQLLTDNAINPEMNSRKIPGLKFPTITDAVTKARIDNVMLECQFTGDTLLEAVQTICERFGLGFKITLNSSNEFIFTLYYGVDRSVEQSDRDPVVFSPEYDTLVNSRYTSNMAEYKNVAVVGEDSEDGSYRVIVYNAKDSSTDYEEEDQYVPTGLDRREVYVEGNGVNSRDADGNELSLDEYLAELEYKGFEELDGVSTTSIFDGEVETGIGPQYGAGKDYFLGDLVTIRNELGMSATAIITEYIRSNDDSNGYSAYPTFEMKD